MHELHPDTLPRGVASAREICRGSVGHNFMLAWLIILWPILGVLLVVAWFQKWVAGDYLYLLLLVIPVGLLTAVFMRFRARRVAQFRRILVEGPIVPGKILNLHFNGEHGSIRCEYTWQGTRHEHREPLLSWVQYWVFEEGDTIELALDPQDPSQSLVRMYCYPQIMDERIQSLGKYPKLGCLPHTVLALVLMPAAGTAAFWLANLIEPFDIDSNLVPAQLAILAAIDVMGVSLMSYYYNKDRANVRKLIRPYREAFKYWCLGLLVCQEHGVAWLLAGATANGLVGYVLSLVFMRVATRINSRDNLPQRGDDSEARCS